MSIFGQKLQFFGQKWSKNEQNRFSQNFHWAILVLNHKCSFYKRNQKNPMTEFGENGQNGRFWAKMGYF